MNAFYKRSKAEYLLNEIGYIDDAFVAEADNFSRSVRVRPYYKFIRGIVAASLVFVIGLGAIVGISRYGVGTGSSENGMSDVPNFTADTVAELDEVLMICSQSSQFNACDADTIDYFDGCVRICVQDVKTGTLYLSRELDVSERQLLSSDLNMWGTRVMPGETPSEYMVWVIMGDGNVVTPCLTESDGNIGVCELFDYDPERLPTRYFMELLERLV